MTSARMIGDGLEKGFVSWWLGVMFDVTQGDTLSLENLSLPDIVDRVGNLHRVSP